MKTPWCRGVAGGEAGGVSGGVCGGDGGAELHATEYGSWENTSDVCGNRSLIISLRTKVFVK